MSRAASRRLRSHFMVGLVGLAVVIAVLPLLLILGTLVAKGASSLNLAFFTRVPVPAGETGGATCPPRNARRAAASIGKLRNV